MEQNRSKKWIAPVVNHEQVEKIAQTFHLSWLTATILSTRSLETEKAFAKFLQPKIADCYSPFLFSDMQKAKDRVFQAIENREKIFIYGDYDADGITSTAILMRAIRDLGGDVDYYIPNRFTEGYGPNRAAFSKIRESGCTLLITVDNGIAGIEEMRHAKEIGMDVILTDHHALHETIPDVYAVIHPKNSNDGYPFSELCGAGVALKFAHALHGRMQDEWLELAAIGTICDLMPLLDENRVIVKNGLCRMMMTKLVGLRVMFKMCKVERHAIDADTIGFIIGPRLNAVGRLHHAGDAVELLITADEAYAETLVKRLDDLNQQRKEIVERITKQAAEQAAEQMKHADTAFLVLADEAWNPGVVGIVASKIVSQFYRPTIVLGGGEDGCLKGSGRSVAGCHIVEALKQAGNYLLHYGGHQMAAGLTLSAENLDAFRTALNQAAKEQLRAEDLIPCLEIDYFGQIEEFSAENIQELERLAPFGSGNPRPIVALKHAEVNEIRTMGAEQQHLRLTVSQARAKMTCVGFHFGAFASRLKKGSLVHIAGQLTLNEWKGKSMPQLRMEDIAFPTERTVSVLHTDALAALLKDERHIVWIVKNIDQVKRLPIDSLSAQATLFSLANPSAVELGTEASAVVIAGEPEQGASLPKWQGVRSFWIYPFWLDEQRELQMDRQDFVRLYKKLRALRIISDRETLKAVGEEVRLTQGHINFYLKVFFDLRFATIEDGKIIMHTNPQKKELTESQTYQSRAKRLRELERYAQYSAADWQRWLDRLGFL